MTLSFKRPRSVFVFLDLPDAACGFRITLSFARISGSEFIRDVEAVMAPGALKSVSFIEKDSKRFPKTSGWGYAQFFYDARLARLSPTGATAHSGKTCAARAIRP